MDTFFPKVYKSTLQDENYKAAKLTTTNIDCQDSKHSIEYYRRQMHVA